MSIHPQSVTASRREREKKAREAAILDAAERVIGRRGFHEAGMAEIAREAGYATGTLYNQFESKEALYERLLTRRAEELFARSKAALARPGTPRERLEAAFEARVAFFADHLDFMRIYATTSVVATAGFGLPARVVRVREMAARALARVVAEAKAEGSLRAEADPMDVAVSLQVLTTAFLVRAAQREAGFEPATVRRAVRAVLFDPLFAGPAKPGRGRRR